MVRKVAYYQIVIQIPEKAKKRLEEVEKKYGIKAEDLLTKALLYVIYEEIKV